MTGEPVAAQRARARDIGLIPGTLAPGPVNAITDVPGVRVGHTTLIEGNDIRTGVTAVVHDALVGRGNRQWTLPAGLAVYNGFGKMVGTTQVAELGTIETPVLLTSTLSVFRVADALLTYMRTLPGYAEIVTLNPVVAETNDSYLSDIWARPITVEHVRAAVENAAAGPVAEGCVGAGTGTRALGFKAGIGTSSRRFALSTGQPITVGALVQANFGGVLTVQGVRVPVPADAGTGRPVLDSNHVPAPADAGTGTPVLDSNRVPAPADAGTGTPVLDSNRVHGTPDSGEPAGNSCVIVLATDAQLDSRQLERVANRAFAAMARVGSDFSGHSGDYALAVSTAIGRDREGEHYPVPQKDLDLIFLAAMEASEEAILNSLFMAVTTTGHGGHVSHAVRLDYVQRLVSGRSANPSAS